jgi:C1A family cysteine protease
MDKIEKLGMGWLPDLPDFRDYTAKTDKLSQKLEKLGEKDSIKLMFSKLGVTKLKGLPASVDLREWCSPIENQEDLGSCTANAGVGMVEYFERRAFGKHIDASRLFLYKTTRNLMGVKGDTGAYLRTTMGALALFGVLPEKYWQYTDDKKKFDKEPPAFCYAFAQNYQSIQYFRLDPAGTPAKDILSQIKTQLSAGIPSMFGFAVYSSISQARTTGKIPYPTAKEELLGGHAIVAVGYDDGIKIKNTNPGGIETKGALIIRNSWSEEWGDKGYGYLPYDYVLNELADDWWSLLKNEWVDTENFGVD